VPKHLFNALRSPAVSFSFYLCASWLVYCYPSADRLRVPQQDDLRHTGTRFPAGSVVALPAPVRVRLGPPVIVTPLHRVGRTSR